MARQCALSPGRQVPSKSTSAAPLSGDAEPPGIFQIRDRATHGPPIDADLICEVCLRRPGAPMPVAKEVEQVPRDG